VCLIARAAIKESANRLGIVSVPLVTSEAEDRKLCAPICQGLSYWHFLKAQQVQVQPRIRSERHHPGVLPTLKHTITIAVTAQVHFETSINLHKFIGWIRHQSTSRRQSKDHTVTVRSSTGEEDFLKLLI